MEGLACVDPGARTPIGVSGIFFGIFALVGVTLLAFTPEGIVVGF